MSNEKLLPCSECGLLPFFYNPTNDATTAGMTKLECSKCGKVVIRHNYEEAAIAWNHYYGNRMSVALQTEEKQKEENEMKDILELVGKIEELLKKSKFEWFMAYDPKSKAWNFQIKEK